MLAERCRTDDLLPSIPISCLPVPPCRLDHIVLRLNGHVTKIQDGDLEEVFTLRAFFSFYRAKRSVAR